MGLSRNEFTYAGSDEFDLNFAMGYASQSDVSCYKVGDPPVDLEFDWLTANRVRLAAGHGLLSGDEIVFRRVVSKQSLPFDLGQPGDTTREALETVVTHTMYALHEVLDGVAADTVPWDIIGGLEEVETVLNFDYLTTYLSNRDGA